MVGWGVTVGKFVGENDGNKDDVGDILGASERKAVGKLDGIPVGAAVANRAHSVRLLPTQSGVKESNCCTVSNTDAKSHNPPLLLL
jgi:hypothetical protein